MDLRFSRRLNGHNSVSLRLNGHLSGPFEQDVSNSCSAGKTPTLATARNKPSATRMHVVKYYTLSIASVCKISRPRAASRATRRGPRAAPEPAPRQTISWLRESHGVTLRIHVSVSDAPAAALRWRHSQIHLAALATSCRAKPGGDRHRAGHRPP